LIFKIGNLKTALNFSRKKAIKDNFLVLKESDIVLRNGFDELISLPGWGNGRDVNQIWEDAKLHRSNRVVNENEITKTITINDIDLAMEKMISNRKKTNIKIFYI